jgi:hypothetical protein
VQRQLLCQPWLHGPRALVHKELRGLSPSPVRLRCRAAVSPYDQLPSLTRWNNEPRGEYRGLAQLMLFVRERRWIASTSS